MKSIVTLIIAVLFPLVVNAEIPKWYQSGVIKGEGTIVSVDIQQMVVVIDDQQMQLSNKIKVHTLAQEVAPLGKIQSGQFIGFNYEPNDQGKIEITEVWIIDKKMMSELDKANRKRSGIIDRAGTIDRKGGVKGTGAQQNKEAGQEKSDKGNRPTLRVSQ